MSNRKLTILGIAAVCMVIWAVVQSHISSRPRAELDTPTYLIQGLDPADIGSIVLGTGENAVTLTRRGGHFVVVNKDNYSAVASKINELITSCLDIRTKELYTDDAANHKDLGVTEEDAHNIVKFLKPDSKFLTGVVIGKTKEQGQGTYVRLVSSDKVYVALESPWIKNRAIDYIDQELTSVNREDIELVTVSYPGGQYSLKAKAEGEDIVLENLPPGKKLKGSDAKRIFTTLTNLRFDDVKKEPTENGRLKFERRFVCRLKDSTVYTVKIAQNDGKTYVTCEADFTDKTPVTKEKEVESEEELKKKEAKLLARDRARDFSVRHRGWVYEIAEYKAKDLTRELSDLIEDEEKPEETEQVSDPNMIKNEL